MDRTARPLVIVTAFSASLVVGLLLMLWAMGGREQAWPRRPPSAGRSS